MLGMIRKQKFDPYQVILKIIAVIYHRQTLG